MIVSPKKLKSFVQTYGASVARPLEVFEPMDDEEREEIEEALADETSEEAEFARKLQAGYMEMKQPAGAFACGQCQYFKEGVCMQPMVRASVDGEHGSCNYFTAEPSEVVFPPNEESAEHEEEEHEEHGDGEDDPDDEPEDDGDQE